MGTRSRIIVKQDNGKFVSAYCHWDGYPSHNGRILKENYTDLSKANVLVMQGAISSLGESTDCPEGHTFDTPVEGHTVFYVRDRGEEDVGCTVHDTLKDVESYSEEYNYLLTDGKWYVACHETDDEFVPLTSTIIITDFHED